MAQLQLTNLDAKLVYLALQYHLARPGSELDRETRQPIVHGLAEVADALEPQLQRETATIELSDSQRERLLNAVSGSINELKTIPILEGRSSVPQFDQALRRLFPAIADDPNEATQLAAHLLPLRKLLAQPTSTAEEAPTKSRMNPWWRFWSRS